jgi:DNA-binding response OmpR family regulator
MPGRLEDVRVLIVDDDEDVLEAIDAALRAEGAQTQAVSDGNAAVVACQDDPPDLVVLDMMLPRRSGFLVLEKIKGREDSPLVIMITANEGRRHQAYAESLGVDRYLLKPVPLERLIDVAVELLEADEDGDTDDGGGDGDGGHEGGAGGGGSDQAGSGRGGGGGGRRKGP